MKSDSPYQPVLPTKIDDIARLWVHDVREIRRQFDQLEPSTTIEVRYEDLTARPHYELERVCEWLGVRFEAKMLEFHEANRINKLEPALTLEWKMRTLEPVSSRTVGRHTALLDEKEASEFLFVAGEELRRYKYLN